MVEQEAQNSIILLRKQLHCKALRAHPVATQIVQCPSNLITGWSQRIGMKDIDRIWGHKVCSYIVDVDLIIWPAKLFV